ncbi:MAG: disulfide bond formation protein B [Pseudomonadales bacterium]|nr:disulfide bond formation protein B [Pseudomonadales bacterium]
MKTSSPRLVFLGMAIFSTGLIATALYMQEVLGLHPCPLCITQRIFVIVVGVLAFLACLHNPGKTGIRVYAFLCALAALLGAGVAARHVWIQNLPEDQVPACGPGLQYMFEHFPFMKALELLFMGDGNCADVVWQFMGLSIPAWTLLAFVCFVIAGVWLFLRAPLFKGSSDKQAS